MADGGSNNPSPGAPEADTTASQSSVQRLHTQQESAGGHEQIIWSARAGVRHSKRSVVRNALNSRPSLAQGMFEDVHGQPNYEATAPTCLEQVHFVKIVNFYLIANALPNPNEFVMVILMIIRVILIFQFKCLNPGSISVDKTCRTYNV